MITTLGAGGAIARARRGIAQAVAVSTGSRRLAAVAVVAGVAVAYALDPAGTTEIVATVVFGLGLPLLIIAGTSIGARERKARLDRLISGETSTPASASVPTARPASSTDRDPVHPCLGARMMFGAGGIRRSIRPGHQRR